MIHLRYIMIQSKCGTEYDTYLLPADMYTISYNTNNIVMSVYGEDFSKCGANRANRSNFGARKILVARREHKKCV